MTVNYSISRKIPRLYYTLIIYVFWYNKDFPGGNNVGYDPTLFLCYHLYSVSDFFRHSDEDENCENNIIGYILTSFSATRLVRPAYFVGCCILWKYVPTVLKKHTILYAPLSTSRLQHPTHPTPLFVEMKFSKFTGIFSHPNPDFFCAFMLQSPDEAVVRASWDRQFPFWPPGL